MMDTSGKAESTSDDVSKIREVGVDWQGMDGVNDAEELFVATGEASCTSKGDDDVSAPTSALFSSFIKRLIFSANNRAIIC